MDLIYRFDPYQPLVRPSYPDADAVLATLDAGNRRFSEFVARMQKRLLGETVEEQIVVPVTPLSLGLPLIAGLATAQAPFALVLGCSDARVPVEQVFDLAFNDLFVVRIAGNVLGTECLGSIDYAVRNFEPGLKLVLVLGHSGCGAVTAAVDSYLNAREYIEVAQTHALRSLVDRILIAVRASAKALGRECGRDVSGHPGYRDALVEMAVYVNAAVTAFDLRRELRALENPELRVAYAVYDLRTLRVHAAPEADGEPFGTAPEGAEDFVKLGTRLAKGVVGRGMLA